MNPWDSWGPPARELAAASWDPWAPPARELAAASDRAGSSEFPLGSLGYPCLGIPGVPKVRLLSTEDPTPDPKHLVLVRRRRAAHGYVLQKYKSVRALLIKERLDSRLRRLQCHEQGTCGRTPPFSIHGEASQEPLNGNYEKIMNFPLGRSLR